MSGPQSPSDPAAHRPESTFGVRQDRGMLEWARRRPRDGYVLGVTLSLRGCRPTPERLAALVTARMPGLPVLAEHLAGPAGQESWHRAPGFSASDHVNFACGPAGLHRFAEQMVGQPVYEDRPRWGLWVLDSEQKGEWLLAYRVHHAAQDGTAVAHTIRRLLAPSPAPSTPVPHRVPTAVHRSARPELLTNSRLLETADVPVDVLRTVSRTTGASVNDIYLTALAGALRTWLPPTERDTPVPVRVPFNVRLRHERQDRGNRFGFTRVHLPVDERSARSRLARVVEQTRDWPRDRTRRVLDRVPQHLLWEHIAVSLEPGDAMASATLLGLPAPLALDGAAVTAGVASPPLAAGHLFSSVLLLHTTRATVSFTARAHDHHVRDLPRLWKRDVAHLLAAASH